MTFVFLFNTLIYSIFIGYSYFFLNILMRLKKSITNLDLLYGILLLSVLSIFLNLFFELKKIQVYIFVLGVFFFFSLLSKKKKLKFNFLKQ